jgi:hypothetical protein
VFAEVTTFQVPPTRVEGVNSLVRGSIVPAPKKQLGFRGLLELVDRDAGRSMVVTLREMPEDWR